MRKSLSVARRLVASVAVLAAASACGDVAREGRSPVYLVVDSLLAAQGNKPTPLTGTLFSDVITNVITPAPCSADSPCPTIFGDSGSVILRAPLKDPGATASLSPTTNNEVTINRVHVAYSRADGRNTPGVDVPFGFDNAITGTIPAGGNLTIGFELVRNVAKQESPLVQLKTSSNIVSVIATLTFYGVDRVGNAIQTTGQITIEFGNFGDQ